ncbi:FG-GAP-like repeat-containing protein [Candidatus Magnetominusculus xianensis]|uniref:Cytochrome c domain-containing protein n=1 Tax=Candidatus Magnetominusculus xianensis TaxID=1748249 RepID=A0ABR5SGM7_9BACT|nr:FG-GAP-like repeat-containing protein [Candidatus Magnetominusculus xianensis]KWT90156.1 hypothetical protein ASN18_1162 [Candidatus Magnetominusculus xianensis]MBF0403649.1 FG-GAP repeat protein [Nitrospirota bacterium]
MRKSKLLLVMFYAAVTAICQTHVYAASDGVSLYESNCIHCHNAIPATDPRFYNAATSTIKSAITNISAMKSTSSIQTLTSTQVQSIADYINSTGMTSNWIAAAVGDFNSDGKTDILWRDTLNGYNYVWLMDGTTVSSGYFLPTFANKAWYVAGVGDFSIHGHAKHPDGYADILWRNPSTGENAIWKLKSDNVTSTVVLPALSGRNWAVTGLGHFDNDTVSLDILWRDLANGYNAVWYLSGTTVNNIGVLPDLTDDMWVVAGTGDFNRDGLTDVVWRHKMYGNNAVWLLNWTSIASAQLLPTVADMNWTIVAIGDFNADGYPDILWRNQNIGANAIWLMNGTAVNSTVVLPSFGP